MENEYQMSLVAEGTRIPIPVPPEKLAVTCGGKNETATVLGLGEVLLLRKPGLRTVKWDSLFPKYGGPYAPGGTIEPALAVERIRKIQAEGKTVRLELLGCGLDVGEAFAVESFDYEERGGEPGDVYYSIELKEWRNWAAKTLDPASGAEEQQDRAGEPERDGNTYTVVRGDSLWAIAARTYGSGGRWREIYDANRDTVGANPNLIYPGQVLVLP